MSEVNVSSETFITSKIGSANGIAELDANGKVPSSQLPSYVDDVLEYNSADDFPATGETGKIYIAKDTNKTYRWGGSVYVVIGSSLALGETDSTAYRGDRGSTAYTHSQIRGNPHSTSFEDLTNKPLSSTYDFSKNADIIKAIAAAVVSLGGTITNDPTQSH